jgi:Protein of unknown function (DUF998)
VRVTERVGEASVRDNAHLAIWGVVGVIGQLAFMAGWLITETWQGPGYSLVSDTISDMQAATAPHVWFPISCFAAGGIGTFCFAAFGLAPALRSAGETARSAPWQLAIAALALGNSFPLAPCRLPDPGCTAHSQLFSAGGLTDAVVSTIALLVLVRVPSNLWQRMRLVPTWQRVMPVMLAARVGCPACFVLLFAATLTGTAQGLAERLLVTSCVLWVLVLAMTAIAIGRHHDHAVQAEPAL